MHVHDTRPAAKLPTPGPGVPWLSEKTKTPFFKEVYKKQYIRS
jgi:hypothetical protein|uniref:Uncharacterized protein n=1 Tax=Faecalibaculum rodentium TaxID=1702221 RepID=A0A140DT22_9FIRM|nr:hypothetical protein AALO17_06650 [Faecalibaculum rodentium]